MDQVLVVDRLHGGNRVDGGDLDIAVALLLHDDVAWQHRADFVLQLERLIGERRVACTKDAVAAEIDVELPFQCLFDIDFGEDAEAFLLQPIPRPRYHLIEWRSKGPYLYFLPQATLAATIIVAVVSLIDPDVLRRTWVYSKKDFAAVAATILVTLVVGVEAGVLTGVVVSLALFLYRTSRPHMAVVGLVPGTEHFRNVLRHEVRTSAHILSLRVDESLYFANARYLEDKLYDMVAQRAELRHVILMCTAVNEIDASALESLEAINQRLDQLGVAFHLSHAQGGARIPFPVTALDYVIEDPWGRDPTA